MRLKKLAALLLALLLLGAPATALPLQAASRAPITHTVDISNPKKNMRDDGYEWLNPDKTLTLDHLNLQTSEDYGIKLPKNATVILKGDNYISAAVCGLLCSGMVTFQGSGTLTITAGDTGIRCSSVYASDVLRQRQGTITINAGKRGIYAEAATITLVGGKMTVNTTAKDNPYAIQGQTVKLWGGTFSANAQVYAEKELSCSSVSVDVRAQNAALACPNGIELVKVAIKTAAAGGNPTAADTYNGEATLRLTSTASDAKKGILFKGDYARFWDYAFFFLIILALAALIAIPMWLRKKRTDKLRAEYEAAHPPRKSAKPPKKQ